MHHARRPGRTPNVRTAARAWTGTACRRSSGPDGSSSHGPDNLILREATGTTKRSKFAAVNGALPTTIIVSGLALAGYALLLTARNQRMGAILLGALGVLEILLLVLVGMIVARLIGGGHPADLAVLIGYLIGIPLDTGGRGVLGGAGTIPLGPGGGRRGRAGRCRAHGPAASDLAGHPCLSQRRCPSPPRRSRPRPGLARAGCSSPSTASSRSQLPRVPRCRSRRSSTTPRSPMCCRPSPAWSTSSRRSPSLPAVRRHAGSPSCHARSSSSACWRSAPGASSTQPLSPMPPCGPTTASATASSRLSFPFSACSGCATGPRRDRSQRTIAPTAPSTAPRP